MNIFHKPAKVELPEFPIEEYIPKTPPTIKVPDALVQVTVIVNGVVMNFTNVESTIVQDAIEYINTGGAY